MIHQSRRISSEVDRENRSKWWPRFIKTCQGGICGLVFPQWSTSEPAGLPRCIWDSGVILIVRNEVTIEDRLAAHALWNGASNRIDLSTNVSCQNQIACSQRSHRLPADYHITKLLLDSDSKACALYLIHWFRTSAVVLGLNGPLQLSLSLFSLPVAWNRIVAYNPSPSTLGGAWLFLRTSRITISIAGHPVRICGCWAWFVCFLPWPFRSRSIRTRDVSVKSIDNW
jgi:hypothetical protein